MSDVPEMVERVRVAVRDEYGSRLCDWDEARRICSAANPNINRPCRCEQVARAAIEAMREPTPDMTDACRDVGPDRPYGLHETCERWRTMIDAALKPSKG